MQARPRLPAAERAVGAAHRRRGRPPARPRSSASASAADYSKIVVPQSREEVIEGAGQAVRLELERLAPSNKKSFKRGQAAKLAVEVSIADQSPESQAQLAAGLLAPLGGPTAATCKLAFHDVEAALAASESLPNEVLSVQDFQPADQSGLLLVVGVPTGKEAEAASLARWRGSLVWVSLDMNSLAYRPTPLRRAFQTCYAFEPFAARGLVRTTEGLILKQPGEGKAGGWLVLRRGWGGEHRVVGRTPERPTASDVELSLYNASAAESPVVQGIKALRSLVPGKKGADGS